jgi:hypothetical protein
MQHTNMMQFSAVELEMNAKFSYFHFFCQTLSKNDGNSNFPLLRNIKILIFQAIKIKKQIIKKQHQNFYLKYLEKYQCGVSSFSTEKALYQNVQKRPVFVTFDPIPGF